MIKNLARTPLHEWHAGHGARLVDFAGWEMPVQYTSIVKEHEATRQHVGLFDISHMARFRFDGPHAAAFLDQLVTRRIADLKPGKIRYALVTNQQGGILDDVLVYHLHEPDGTRFFWMVVNAGNRAKISDWIKSRPGFHDVTFTDETTESAMIAVQGPRALEAAQTLFGDEPLDAMSNYSGCVSSIQDRRVIVSRTGYTGEDGVELILPADFAVELWETLMHQATSLGGGPVGLGARDTLRLEAGMPLYGHELAEDIDPFQAGLGFAVNLKGRAFPGHQVLAEAAENQDRPRRVGLVLDGKRVAREHYPIIDSGGQVGEITSGTFSPTFQRPIAMGYVQPQLSEIGTKLQIDLRGQNVSAEVVELPFYRRT